VYEDAIGECYRVKPVVDYVLVKIETFWEQERMQARIGKPLRGGYVLNIDPHGERSAYNGRRELLDRKISIEHHAVGLDVVSRIRVR